MNEDYFENTLNQFLWRFIEKHHNNTIIFSNHDHTFKWYPQGYRLPVYLNNNISDEVVQSIRIQLTKFLVIMTGLEYSKIRITFYRTNNLTAES